jgi:hypothetical protein
MLVAMSRQIQRQRQDKGKVLLKTWKAQDETRPDKTTTRQDKTNQDKTKTRQKTRQRQDKDKTRQRQDKTENIEELYG